MSKAKKRNIKTGDLGFMCGKCGKKMGVDRTCAEVNGIRRIRKCVPCNVYRVTWES